MADKRIGLPEDDERGDQEPDTGEAGGSGKDAENVLGGGAVISDGDIAKAREEFWARRSKDDALLRQYWQTGGWRDRPQYLVVDPQPIPEKQSRDRLLRLFNPSCTHDRTSFEVMHCDACLEWTEKHWADVVSVGSSRPKTIE